MPRSYGTTNAAPYASAPAVGVAGDTYYNTAEKAQYTSDGTAWRRTGPGAVIATAAPANPIPGQLWFRTDPDCMLFIYYDDGTSQQWVPVVGQK